VRKAVWVIVFLLCWWVVGPVPLEDPRASGAPDLSDRRGMIEKKLKLLDSQTLMSEIESSPTEKKDENEKKQRQRKTENDRQREPEQKKPSKAPVDRDEQKRPVLYYQGPSDQKRVALTFDDGPDWRYTARILDILKREKVRATFFLVGRMAERRPDLVRRMVREGHVVANHTWNHPNLPRLRDEQVKQEIERTNRVIWEITGRSPVLFRAPYGSLSQRVERLIAEEGMTIVHWNVDTRDWDGRSSDQIIQTVRQQAGPGSVILQHTAGRNLDNTVAALPQIIADLKKQGYTMVTVPELLGIPAYEESEEPRTIGAARN
jgi:peptidoglycan/xylan/chitin deacetylase (PgdA/CDA1 family)